MSRGVPIRCSRVDCSYEWVYTGISRFYASCPMCRRVNKLVITPLESSEGEERKE